MPNGDALIPALIPGCELAIVLNERTKNQAQDISDIKRKIDRLPHWAVIVGWLMAGTIGYLLRFIH